MKRRLFTILSVLSLLVCLATATIWLRSYWREDGVNWRSDGEGWGFDFSSFRGSFYVEEFSSLGSPFVMPYSQPAEDEAEFPSLVYDFSFLGFHYGDKSVFRPAGPRWVAVVPYWFMTLTFASFFGAFTRYRHRLPRQPTGLCAKCGYDLRASKECCPKCGTPVPAPALAPDSAALHRLPWKRRLFVCLPLTLFLAFGLLWVVSCLLPIGFQKVTATDTVAAVSEKGLLYLTHITLEGEPSEWRIVDHDTAEWEVFKGGEDHSTLPGVWLDKEVLAISNSSWPGPPPTPWLPYFSVGIAYWIPCLLFGFLSVVGLLRRLRSSRQRQRLMQGLCPTCGYDLRASKDRCPECGTPIPAGLIRKPVA